MLTSEEHPDENRQGQRSYQFALAVISIFDAAIDEIDHDFDKGLHLAWCSGRGLLRCTAKNPDENDAKQYREKHRVDVERHWVAGAVVPDPFTVRPAHLQVMQVMRNVIAGR